ncbi:MAG: patatin-like phospholipase family protein [Candidatus Omnitrophica bacterium]|nr:patatin-like phospholipase family protein [Candidatus Omnitrophota bacterium]
MRLFAKKKKAVTLVLGGGSARGIAHIGVLRVLEREGLPISLIVGTSMGALVGAAYATGITPDQMQQRAAGFTLKKLLDPTVPKMGLLAGDKLELIIKDLLDSRTFADCRIPLAVVTTDIEKAEEIVYTKGDLVKVVRASCSWPGIFNPVRIDGRLLVDGGIKHSVPTRIARQMGDAYTIAVDVGFCVKRGRIDNIFQMIVQSFQITGEELNRYQSEEADAVIKVDLPDDIDQTAFHRYSEIIEKGRQAAERRIGQIKKELKL